MQDLGPGRAHAHPLAGGEHDGQTAAGVGGHGRLLSRQGAAPEARLARRIAGRISQARAISPRPTAVSSHKAIAIDAVWPPGAKCVSLRRKKRYTTNWPRTERAGLAARFSPPRLTFHFGWERRQVGPSLCGPVRRRANEEYDGGQATSRILEVDGRRGARGFVGPVRLVVRRRRTARPAGSVRRRHGREDGGRTRLETVQGAGSRRCRACFPVSPSSSMRRSGGFREPRSGATRNSAFRLSLCIGASSTRRRSRSTSSRTAWRKR